jgi:hypothetical protein
MFGYEGTLNLEKRLAKKFGIHRQLLPEYGVGGGSAHSMVIWQIHKC